MSAPTNAGAWGAAPAASPAVEPATTTPRSGLTDPLCECGQPASEHTPLGGLTFVGSFGAGMSRQQPGLKGVCGRPRWEVHAAAARALRCSVTVQTARFTWSCLRPPHEGHPDQHVMTAVPR